MFVTLSKLKISEWNIPKVCECYKANFVTLSILKIAEWSIPKFMLMLTFPKHYEEDKCIKESLN